LSWPEEGQEVADIRKRGKGEVCSQGYNGEAEKAQEMIPFEIIPKGRTKKDAECYKFLRWWIRENKDFVNSELHDMILNAILYGDSVPRISWDMEHQIKEEMKKGKVYGHFC